MIKNFIVDKPRSASENMQIDAEALHQQEKSEATCGLSLRIMSFTHPAVTLGNKEDASRSLNNEYVTTHEIETARRPTGGRAIYHHNNESELTFSFIAPRQHARLYNDSLSSVFAFISQLLIDAISPLIEQEQHKRLLTQTADAPATKFTHPSSCFDSLARYELSVQGEKVFGSAQKRTSRALLVQSTLLLKGNSETAKVLKTGRQFMGLSDHFPPIQKEAIINKLEKQFSIITGGKP